MAKRQNKTWAPSWREDREKGARSVQHHFGRIVNLAQRGGEAWRTQDAADALAEIRATLEEAEAALQRYQEREAA